MTSLLDRAAALWPRSGVLATDAGRRVAMGVALLAAGTALLAAAIVGVIALVATFTGAIEDATVRHLLTGMVGGLAVVGLAFLMLPLAGRLVGVGRDLRLLELSNPGSPLLRELMDVAPGTYSHSIMTGSLAETAARDIGANPLLARVGAYYHDVGKMVRPVFFVENLAGEANPHDIASPAQSAMVITAHVREGAALARRYRLPDEVVDIIREHHGTSLVRWFYDKAKADGKAVVESDFRYDGELPRTREAALVMLADGCEAAARAMSDPTPARLEELVRRILDAKVQDGQLAESHMSDADLESTVRAYAKMLVSVHHGRVSYPDEDLGRSDHAGAREQQPGA